MPCAGSRSQVGRLGMAILARPGRIFTLPDANHLTHVNSRQCSKLGPAERRRITGGTALRHKVLHRPDRRDRLPGSDARKGRELGSVVRFQEVFYCLRGCESLVLENRCHVDASQNHNRMAVLADLLVCLGVEMGRGDQDPELAVPQP
jgi:hypothetical protein